MTDARVDPDVLSRIRMAKRKARQDQDEKLERLLDHAEEELEGAGGRIASLENQLIDALDAVRLHEAQARERRDTTAELEWRLRADNIESYIEH